MKTRKLFSITSAIAAVLLVGTLGLHATQVVAVSVNFTGNGGGGIDNGQTTSLTNIVKDPTGATVETAGAPGFATTNWNNFDKYGDVTSGIIDNSGADSGLHMMWDAVSGQSSGAYSTLHTSNSKLMDGLDGTDWAGGPPSAWTANNVYNGSSNQKPVEYISGLNAWMAAKGAVGYSVVLYVQGWHGWGGASEHWIQAAGGNPSSSSMTVGGDLTPRMFCTDNGQFSGTFTQVPSTSTNYASRTGSGNYIVFSGLTNDAILIQNVEPNGDYQAGKIFGFQIVAEFPTALTVGTATASVANPVVQGTTDTLSAPVSGGTAPYKYQWLTDGGSGGTLTNIPSATNATLAVNTTGMIPGVNFSYSLVVTDSVLATATSAPVVVNVIQVLPGTLAGTANVAPTPGIYDISQLADAGWNNYGGLNYYTDWGWNANKYCGQTFTTGTNALGYTMNSLAIKLNDGGQGGQASGTTYDLFIYQISPDGSTATVIADVTNLMASTFAYPDWAQWNFSGVTLNSNSVYGYGFGRRSGGSYIGLAAGPNWYDAYSAGQMAAFPKNGGAVTYAGSGYGDTSHDGVFDIGLIPNGIAIVLNPATAAPNPAYALTPVKMADTVAVAGSATTYKWLTDDGSGGYNVVPGATSTNLTVIPPDLNPGGADYTTNYYFVATDVLGNSATSSVIALTIHAATVPLITGPTPANVVTFVGDSRSFTFTENGTLPITNQWQFNNGGG